MRSSPGPKPKRHEGPLPWAKLRSAAPSPQVYRRMVDHVDPKACPGDLVAVYDKADEPYGVALYNPRSLITLRMLTRDVAGFDADVLFEKRLRAALELRRDVLGLDRTCDVYRLVHDLGDGFPGLVVDRYGEWVVLEFYSLGMFRQAKRLERILGALLPGARFVHRASDYSEKMEGFQVLPAEPVTVRVRENGIVFEVDLAGGHKTGFFCDQRDNRMAVGSLAAGRRVLDVCSFTGGFGLYASKIGHAQDVTCVELDPEAAERARRNANLNRVKVNTVCADAFPYLRQMAANGERYGLVVLDPYKLIASREGFRQGRQKYIDLNRLALGLAEEGGLLVTCSCSGMLPWDDFAGVLRTAAAQAGRRVQIFRKTGAGGDHPFAVDHAEGEYLKVLWCRVA